ncbi:MAG: GGDEF domain-containing protein [Clostridium sp.]|nr:GGDEF domain-containing protein [Clostridium sp.]
MDENVKLIGLFVARTFEENNLNFIHAMQNLGKKEGYKFVIFSMDTTTPVGGDSTPAEAELCGLAEYLPLEAFIILGETIKNMELIDGIAGIARRRHIPCFCLDREAGGSYPIRHDYTSGFEKMVRHVVEEHGARRVNMLAGFEGHALSEDRVMVYRKVLEENGIAFEEERVGYGQFWEVPARKEMERFLKSDLPMPEAIVCANDVMALVACNVLEEAGYRVPEDVIVTGFDGVNDGKYYRPVLATCAPDYEGAVWFIFDKVQEWRATGQIRPESFSIRYIVEKNQSCGCPVAEMVNRNKIIRSLADSLGDCAWHTHAMNQMLTSALPLRSLQDLAQILPKTEYIWRNDFRYAAVKEELIQGTEVNGKYHSMVTLMCGGNGRFQEAGEHFPIEKWLDVLNAQDDSWEIILVRVLNAGKTVYGYSVDGFHDIHQRDAQRCDEFSMFLSNSINLVLQNQQLNCLKQNLLRANKELANLSELDAMTELYNRRGFYKYFTRMLSETKRRYAVLVSVDMNRLKHINDTYGHAEGDFAICTLAHGVKAICGTEAVCARFGGDEFDSIVFADDVTELTEEILEQRLQEHIDRTEGVDRKPYQITASIGVVIQERSRDLNIERMIGEADTLMYRNKKKNR